MTNLKYQLQTSNLTLGSSNQGYIRANFDELTKAFGYPETFGDRETDGKVKHLWTVNVEGVIITIYDYKQDLNTGKTENWHIGGYEKIAPRLIEQILNETK